MMIEYTEQILSLIGLLVIALLSPGPDFAIIVKNSLIYSRRTALLTALGIALGCVFQVSAILLGLGTIITSKIWLLKALKYLGASYLIYIGYKGIRAKKTNLNLGSVNHQKDISVIGAIRSGFLVNALNPKAILFFISLFSLVISPNTPFVIMLVYLAICFALPLTWFCFVAFCFTGEKMRNKFSSIGYLIDRLTGGILMVLGIRILWGD